MSKKFRHVGDHVEDLDDGRTVEPGEAVKLEDSALKSDHNKRLIDEGILVEIPPPEKKEGDKA